MTDIIIGLVVALLFGGGAYYAGKRQSNADRAKEKAAADAAARVKAKEARNEVDRMSDADVDRELRDRARKP